LINHTLYLVDCLCGTDVRDVGPDVLQNILGNCISK
jgi:hypothetical protein